MLAIDPATATAARSYPSVSLLVPLSAATPWRTRLAQLRRDAEARLRVEFGDAVDPALLDGLARAVDGAEAPPGARSVAVYVNAGGSHTVGIDLDVRERAVVDDTFATRDLLAEDLCKPRYWLLALDLDHPRLLHGHGSRLFPVPIEPGDLDEHPSGSKPHRHRRDSTDAGRILWLRALDQALTAPLSNSSDPVIVVGAKPTISKFLETTRHIALVENVVQTAPATDLATLADVAAPALRQLLAERRGLALAALSRATRAGTAVSGLERVWRAAHRNPGLLLVEQTFEQPARLLGGGIIPSDDAAAADVIDDAVDELIEAVLARSGRVELLPDRSLRPHQRVAFVPRDRRQR